MKDSILKIILVFWFLNAPSFSLSEENIAHLQLTVDPLSESDNYGIELYENTLDLL